MRIIALDFDDVVVINDHMWLYIPYTLVAINALYQISTVLMLFLDVLFAICFAFHESAAAPIMTLEHGILVETPHVPHKTFWFQELFVAAGALDAIYLVFMNFLHVQLAVCFAFQIRAAMAIFAFERDIGMIGLHVRPQTRVVYVHSFAVNAPPYFLPITVLGMLLLHVFFLSFLAGEK